VEGGGWRCLRWRVFSIIRGQMGISRGLLTQRPAHMVDDPLVRLKARTDIGTSSDR